MRIAEENARQAMAILQGEMTFYDPFPEALKLSLEFTDLPVKDEKGKHIGYVTASTIRDDGSLEIDMKITDKAHSKLMQDILKHQYVTFE